MKTKLKQTFFKVLLGVLFFSSHAWSAQQALLINGAGATFPYPIYSKWFDEYSKTNPDIHFNYQSIGSGGGIRQASEQTVDFGATDGPMNDEQIMNSKTKLLHFPTVLGAVVATYNVPEIKGDLNLTSQALAGIYLGKITKWNDPEITQSNTGISLPDKPIIVVHRSDGSGTSYIFVDYLSKVSLDWKNKVGVGTSVSWPVGLGGKGNEGVTGLVKQTPYSIGYVELIYAEQNNLPTAAIQTAAGNFLKASLKAVTAAASSVADKMPADFRVSITNAPGKEPYPISSFTWLLIPKQINDPKKGKAIVDFLKWMLNEGQGYAANLKYAPLPPQVIEKEKDALNKIKY